MDKQRIFIQACLIIIVAIFYGIGFTVGYNKGLDRANAIQDQVDCESDYGYEPIEKVPVKCLKYFDLKK